MPKSSNRYTVTVLYSQRKAISVWANDESEAEEKACDVVNKWSNVVEAEAEDCRREAP